MGLRINTNVASLMAQNQLGRTQRETSAALSELATGSRFSSASRDSAGHAIAENLRSQESGLEVAQRNADVASSFIQTAEGSLNEQNNILIRQRELAVQAASDTNSDVERGFINKEFKQLGDELDRIAQSTAFGSTKMLNGNSDSFDFQVGTSGDKNSRITYENDTDTTASGLGVSGLDVSDKSGARDAIENIDKATVKVNGARAKFGATQSRLESAGNFLGSQIETIAEAHSKIADTDVADAVSRVRRGQILQQYQVTALAQANETGALGLKLIA
jgi:flagellin